MAVAVISKTGQKLMPTSERHAARLLKSGKAVIEQYRPIFTIRLTKRKRGNTQPIEYASDTGYQHVGVSIKSESGTTSAVSAVEKEETGCGIGSHGLITASRR